MNNQQHLLPAIYCRKSSEQEDRQVLSLEGQLREAVELATANGFTIEGASDVFTESKSAKSPGRPTFDELVRQIEAGRFNVLILFKLDRAARNMQDGGRIIQLLQEGRIRKIITAERTYLPTDNVMMMAVELGMANQYSRDLSTHVKNSFKTKAALGQFPGLAPIGYLNDLSREEGSRTIIPDPERFDSVRKLWDLMLTGAYSTKGLWRIAANEWRLTTPKYGRRGGNVISPNTLSNIFTNVFYLGRFVLKGEEYVGSHPQMVSESEFWQVQTLLGRKGLPRPQQHFDFAYTGSLIRCGECGCSITAEVKRKANKGDGRIHEWTYYRCSKKGANQCSQKYVEVKDLEAQMDSFLATLTLPQPIVDWAVEQVRKEHEMETGLQSQYLANLYKALEKNEAAKKRLTDLRINDQISDTEFSLKRAELIEESRLLEERLGSFDSRSNLWIDRVEEALSFCATVRESFKTANSAEKRQILVAVGSNLVLRDKKLTIEPGELFIAVQKANKTKEWLAYWNDFRTANWIEILEFPDLTCKHVNQFV